MISTAFVVTVTIPRSVTWCSADPSTGSGMRVQRRVELALNPAPSISCGDGGDSNSTISTIAATPSSFSSSASASASDSKSNRGRIVDPADMTPTSTRGLFAPSSVLTTRPTAKPETQAEPAPVPEKGTMQEDPAPSADGVGTSLTSGTTTKGPCVAMGHSLDDCGPSLELGKAFALTYMDRSVRVPNASSR